MSEEKPITVFQEDVTASVDLILQDKLAKANITEHTLAELRDELTDLAKIEVTDKKALALIQGGITKAVNRRGIITRICKKGRESALMEQRSWIAKEKELVALVEEVEKPLVALKEAFLAEQERVAREAAEAEARMIRERVIALEGFGFTRKAGAFPEPDTFVNGSGTVITTAQVEVKDEQVWTNLIKSVKWAWEEENDRREAEERRVAEERVAREEEERRLAEQRAEIERKQAELDKAINTIRKNELLALGCETWFSDEADGSYEVEFVGVRSSGPWGRYAHYADDLCALTDEEWNYEKALAAEAVRRKNDAIRQQEKEREAERIRIGELQDIGALPDEYPALPLHQYDEEKWKEEVRMVKVLVDKREEDTRKELLIAERVRALKGAGWYDELPSQDGVPVIAIGSGASQVTFMVPTLAVLEQGTIDHYVQMGRADLARREEEKAEAIRKQERERIAAQQEQERKDAERRAAQMTDIEKWEAFIALIESSAPKMDSPIGNHAVGRVIKGLREMSHKVIEDLKK